MMNNAWSVAVRLNLINHVTPGLSLISRHLATTGQDVKKLQTELHKIKLLGMAGAAIGGAGFMGLGLIAKTIKPASEYAHQLALMNTAGMKHLEIVNATKAAWAATRIVPTESVMSNMEAIRDLRMVLGDTAHAIEFMPTIQKVQGLLGTLRHGQAGNSRNESYDLAKALEMKGAVRNQAMFTEEADLMTKALVASGGKVNAKDYLSTYKYGRIATSGWNNEFAYKILPTLIQEMKGGGGSATGGPGSALMSAYAAVVGGVVPQKALKLWQQLHLLDPSKVEWTKVGEAKGVRPGGILGSAEFQANPYKWVQSFLIPALQKAGYSTEAQQKQALQYLFPNRTAGFVMSQFVTQPWKFERDRKLIEGAQGLSSYDQLLKSDPMMARQALEKQWESHLAIVGYQIMPAVISGTLKIMSGLRALSGWMKEHSTTTKVLVTSFVGLSAAMAIGGTLMMLKVGFSGIALVLPFLTGGSAASLPGLIALLGKGGLVMAAGAAGYAIGNLINKLLGIENGELGSWLYDKMNPDKGTHPGWEGNTWVGLKKNNQIQVHVHNKVDQRGITTMVTRGMEQGMSQPQGGTSFADAMMHAPTPAILY